MHSRKRVKPILLARRGRSVAVLLDLDNYERLEYAAHLRASYLEGAADLNEGRSLSQAAVVRYIEARIKK